MRRQLVGRLIAVVLLSGNLSTMAVPPVKVSDIVPDIMPGDVELAVIPRPQDEQMAPTMIVVGQAAIGAPQWDSLRAGRQQLCELLGVPADNPARIDKTKTPADQDVDTLVLVGIGKPFPLIEQYDPRAPATLQELSGLPNREQAYFLSVRHLPDRKRNVVVILSTTPQGAFYAIQTLKQIAFRADDKLYIREGKITDWPAFKGRGGKRTTDKWFYALKCNLHYENPSRFAEDHFGNIWIAGLFPVQDKALDATPEGIQKMVDRMKQMHERGASDYRVHVDDQPLKLTPETEELFRGDYHAAMAHLLIEVYQAMKKVNPKATLYFCAQPYWTQTPYEDYAKRLWASKRPPQDFAMAINGPQVTSTPIPPDDVARYSRVFGASRPALIVDWHGRAKSFGPIEPRQASLAKHAVGIAPGMGTATMRATRLDWGWNPEGYDPDRSLMLACREFAGFENWKRLYELVASFEYALPGPKYEPRDQALAKFEKSLDRAGQRLEELKALPNGGLNGRIKLPEKAGKGFAGNVVSQIEPAYRELAEERRAIVRQYGYREIAAVRVSTPPKIDGEITEKAWESAPPASGFLHSGKPVADNQQTTFRCLYDDRNLYVGLRLLTPGPVNLEDRTTVLGLELPSPKTAQAGRDKPGIFALHGWHALSLMLDPKHTHHTAYEFDLDAAGRRADGLYDTASEQSPNGIDWNSNWKSVVKLHDSGWEAELAIPWRDLGVTPKQGMVMGLQIWRSGKGMKSGKWSYMPRWWGVQSPRQFGHLVLE